jgi:hypothetical protein
MSRFLVLLLAASASMREQFRDVGNPWRVFQVVLLHYLIKDQKALNSFLNAIEIETRQTEHRPIRHRSSVRFGGDVAVC